MNDLRPTKLEELIGQKDVINILKIIIHSAQERQDALPHILFNGPPGLGKTTLSKAIANEMGGDIQLANGPAVSTVKSIVPYIMRIEEHGVLFIDEIHRIGTAVSEFLYPVMEDFRCDIEGKGSDKISYDLPKFTLIGATTEAGSLEAPFRDRFEQKLQLEPYTVDELIELLEMNAEKLSLKKDQLALREIAVRGRGVARITNSYLKWVRDYMIATKKPLDSNLVRQAMNLKGIDPDGTRPEDRKYLEVLKRANKPLGLNTLISYTGLDKETVEGTIEPFLLRRGLIEKTSKGRVLA